jgi:transposase
MSRAIYLTEKQWKKLEPLLPKLKSSGRPWKKNREVVEGILWILRTGARWKDLPEKYPSPSTCWRRLKMWEEQGVWEKIWRTFIRELDKKSQIKWMECFIDGSFVSAKKGAHRSAKPSGARARSSWWWQTAGAFLWECKLPLPPHMR